MQICLFIGIIFSNIFGIATEIDNTLHSVKKDIDSAVTSYINLSFLRTLLYIPDKAMKLDKLTLDTYKELAHEIDNILRSFVLVLRNENKLNKISKKIKKIKEIVEKKIKDKGNTYIGINDKFIYDKYKEWSNFFCLELTETEIRNKFKDIGSVLPDNLKEKHDEKREKLANIFLNNACFITQGYNLVKRLILSYLEFKEFQKKKQGNLNYLFKLFITAVGKNKVKSFEFVSLEKEEKSKGDYLMDSDEKTIDLDEKIDESREENDSSMANYPLPYEVTELRNLNEPTESSSMTKNDLYPNLIVKNSQNKEQCKERTDLKQKLPSLKEEYKIVKKILKKLKNGL